MSREYPEEKTTSESSKRFSLQKWATYALWFVAGCMVSYAVTYANDPYCDSSELSSEVLIDDFYELDVASNWRYKASTDADFDGDGDAETLWVFCCVGVFDDEVEFDDGQHWQAYIEEPNGERTYIYSKYIQMGDLDAAIVFSEDTLRKSIILHELNACGVTLYEVQYRGVKDVACTGYFRRSIDGIWIRPSIAAE